ncbi:MAG: VIT family protein [Sphingobium sp.]|nr:VIT family protein [Sphingobium sp.]
MATSANSALTAILDQPHHEEHYVHRTGWLRAAVLGANDGIVSTASLIVGIAASGADKGSLLLSGAAALVAGAMSMAAGEFVSVSSQADIEKADLKRERRALDNQPEIELAELAAIYVQRGLEPALAKEVAQQLHDHDALAAHARDELGISDEMSARPFQAAFASALSFAAGATVPLLSVAFSPVKLATPVVAGTSLACLIATGWAGAYAGGAKRLPAIVRVTFWGVAAMALTAIVGRLFGAVV